MVKDTQEAGPRAYEDKNEEESFKVNLIFINYQKLRNFRKFQINLIFFI